MSFFGVTLEEISEIYNPADSDRISVAKMKDLSFQIVVGRDEFKPGDKVLYFPLDCLMSDLVMDKLPLLKGKLSGAQANRVKTCVLRKNISQGVLASPFLFFTQDQINTLTSEEITSILGVEKYEAPILISNDGFLHKLPAGYSAYDIEGADRNAKIIEHLIKMKVVVVITEKLEGTNFSCGVETLEDQSSKVFVNQKNYSIIEKEGIENTYWKAARKEKIIPVAEKENLTLCGELVGPGIQNNIYRLKDHFVYIFDMKRLFKGWLNRESFNGVLERHPHIKQVPVIFIGLLEDFLKGKTVQEMADGPSLINPAVNREGIVISSYDDFFIDRFGRAQIKQRGPIYLSKEKD